MVRDSKAITVGRSGSLGNIDFWSMMHTDQLLDIFVIKETELPMANRADDLKPMLSSVLIHINVHIYTPLEVEEFGKEPFTFFNSILKSGQIVFDNQQV